MIAAGLDHPALARRRGHGRRGVVGGPERRPASALVRAVQTPIPSAGKCSCTMGCSVAREGTCELRSSTS